MFFVSTFQRAWKWHKSLSHEQPSEKRSREQVVSAAEEMRLHKHHSVAVSEFQKVKRNYFLERRTFL